ncbi:MAG TPA: hemerythrin family protein [Candidatus Polarisedimenticolaceae bacterium]
MTTKARPDDVRLGVPAIDAEHEAQLKLLDALEAAAASGDRERTRDRLATFVTYLDAHFLSEQLLMRGHAYPGYAAHVQDHEAAIGMMNELRERIDAGEDELQPPVLDALRRWLIGHVTTVDRDFAEFLKERGKAR